MNSEPWNTLPDKEDFCMPETLVHAIPFDQVSLANNVICDECLFFLFLRTWAMLYQFDCIVYVNNLIYTYFHSAGTGVWVRPVIQVLHGCMIDPIKNPGDEELLWLATLNMSCYIPFLVELSVSIMWLHWERTPGSLHLVSPGFHPTHLPLLNVICTLSL